MNESGKEVPFQAAADPLVGYLQKFKHSEQGCIWRPCQASSGQNTKAAE
jgi:hypothetical protein